MSLTGNKTDPDNCLHCALCEAVKTFQARRPDYGGQAMVLDILSTLVEVICSGMVNTTSDEATQASICDRVLNMLTTVVPREVERALPHFRAGAQQRKGTRQ